MTWLETRRSVCLWSSLLTLFLTTPTAGEDWPEWRGKGRLGVWNEAGIVDAFPDDGLAYVWRVPIHAGYAGPAVADGRVFVTDFRSTENTQGVERAVALDEASGKLLWSHQWPADYAGLDLKYATGPRATPTVDGDRVYVLGAMGALLALDVASGEVQWRRDFVADYGTEVPTWGMAGAPLVEGSLLIALAGGADGAEVVAFDKLTGREAWRALEPDPEPGYAQPIIVDAGGTRQLIVWHPEAVVSLEPARGRVYWRQPFKVSMGMTVATPVTGGRRLLVSAFFNGSMMLALDAERPAAERLWQGKSQSEIDTDGLHALMSTPVIDGGVVYGIGSYGQLRGLDAGTGERLWESRAAVVERARWAAAFLVRHGDRYFINNDRGELILARLSRDGYQELDRTPLIEPTSPASRRRQKGKVHWSHPAYANGHVVTRNDREIVRADLRRRE